MSEQERTIEDRLRSANQTMREALGIIEEQAEKFCSANPGITHFLAGSIHGIAGGALFAVKKILGEETA